MGASRESRRPHGIPHDTVRSLSARGESRGCSWPARPKCAAAALRSVRERDHRRRHRARAAAARADGAHPALRDQGRRAVPAGPGARTGAPGDGPGGGRGRRRLGVAGRRPLDRHLPRARARAGPRRAPGQRCCASCSAGRAGSAPARAARCTSPASSTATSARTRSSVRTCRSPAGWRGPTRCRASETVTVCFFGDGTTNIGAFHEALNMAAVWSLPVVFVCENNHYMEYTPITDVIAVKRPAADRAAAYGLAPLAVDGNDRRRGARRGRRGCATGPGRRRAGPDGGRDLPARWALGGRPGHLSQRGRGGAVEAARSAAAARRAAAAVRGGPGGDRGDRHPGRRGDRADHGRGDGRPTAGRGHRVDGHVERRGSQWRN